MTRPCKAAVIGAGVIGCACAFELAKAGYEVTVLDKGSQAGAGSTSNSSAIIRTFYSVFESCALACEGRAHWRDWEAHLGLPPGRPLALYRETGCLVVKAESNGHLENVCAMMDRLGCPYEHVAARDLSRFLPGLDLARYAPAKRPDDPAFALPSGGEIAGAVLFPQAGYVNDPALAAQNLQWAAQAEGASFHFRAEVVAITTREGRVAGLRLADGREIEADVVLNAGGPWSSRLNAMAGVDAAMTIATRPLRQEVAYLAGPRDIDFFRDGLVLADGDAEFYARPDPVGMAVGSTDPVCDPRAWIEDPDALDPAFSDAWTTIVTRAAQRFPSLAIPNRARGVVALYDVSDDWLPIYDRSDLPGYYMACGTSGNQFKTAPVVGKIMARLIAACEAGHDHDAAPLDMRLERLGVAISLGVFSRRRSINRASSFSVIG